MIVVVARLWEEYGSFSKIGVPKHRPQYTILLIMGTPKKDTPNHGKPQMAYAECSGSTRVGLR